MHRQTLRLFGLILVSTFALAMLWEFALEDIILAEVGAGVPESVADKWEYVITATAFVVLALAAPLGMALRADIRRRDLERGLRQAATVFENTLDGVMITGVDGNIMAVNKAFTRITGFALEEVLGRNPRLLRSDRHDRGFYEAMHSSVSRTGHWQGEVWNRCKSGELLPVWENISAIRDEEGRTTSYVAVFSDISAIKRSQERLAHLAHHDALTDLPNRLLLEDRLTHALEHARRGGHRLAVLFLDLDGFKAVNDSLGHHRGDLLLQQVADRLTCCVREADTVARLGGDEFIVILESLKDRREVTRVAGEILQLVSGPLELDGHPVSVTTSIGISLYPDDGGDVTGLVRCADTAMYRAKASGRNNLRFYAETDAEEDLAVPAVAGDGRPARA